MFNNYHDKIEKGLLKADPAQAEAMRALAHLAEKYGEYRRQKTHHFWTKLKIKKAAQSAPKGLYLWGGVGAGKTMMMDFFFAHVPSETKIRLHFHAFMLSVHDYLHQQRQTQGGQHDVDNGIIAFADDFARRYRLLCFDEFYVTDVADAMILGRLFARLFEKGVVIVTTSNFAPDDLYKDGLQRDRFLPFISLLKQRLEIIHVQSLKDYRLARAREKGTYFWPNDADALQQAHEIFGILTDQEKDPPYFLNIKGHQLAIKQSARGVVFFDFLELCDQNLGVVDYLALCDHYHSFIVVNVPVMDDEVRDKLRRFITFIDTVYERKRRLIITAASLPQKLYTGEKDQALFVRTVSRLLEMQAKDYDYNLALTIKK